MNEFNVSKTRELDLCVSCEICLAVCPVEAISMEYTLGKFLPRINSAVCIECEKCLDNCPGIDIIPQKFRSEKNFDAIIKGNLLECFTAYSRDAKLRHNSSSGGIITTLIKELIESKEYESVFVLDFDKFENSPVRLEETDKIPKIVKSAKSKYLPASVFNIINKLKENANNKIILIGTPCQLSGIKKFIKSINISENNILFLGLFCTSTMNFNFLRFIQENYSKHGEIIKEFTYRTKEKFGWYGNPKITFNSGRNIFLDRVIITNLKKYFGLNRCLFCFDKANKNADIVFADCYIKNKQDVKGTSNILVRTEKGKDIFEKYSYLFIIENEFVEQIWESQNIQNEKQHLTFSKILAKEEGLIPEIEEKYHITPSDKQKLNKLQEYAKWGEIYRKRKIKNELTKALFIRSIKKLLLIIVDKTGKFVLLPLLLLKGYLVNKKKRKIANKFNRENIVIIGGKFFNEGAQAMSLVAMDQLKQKSNQIKLYHFTNSYKDLYNSKIRCYKSILHPWTINEQFRLLGKPFNYIARSSPFKNQSKNTISILENSKFIIDLSGFAISSEIREFVWIPFLLNLIIAKQFSIPFYIFPQSLGPFDFKIYERIFLYPLLKWYLKYPQVIFCREKDSYRHVRRFTKGNIKISYDVVLQHKLNTHTNIVQNDLKFKKIDIEPNSVGVVPNARVLVRSNKDYIDLLYQSIIKTLLNSNKNVYIMYHSFQDLPYCLSLKNLFPENENVEVISEELNSIELENVTKQFEFVITSRYHSVIQAYKNGVPAVVIGWAGKYFDLLTQFKQIQYYFDIRETPSLEEVIQKVSQLMVDCKTESDKIQNKMEEIIKLDSPFNIFADLL